MALERQRTLWLSFAIVACLTVCPGSGVSAQTEVAADAAARGSEPGSTADAPAQPAVSPDTSTSLIGPSAVETSPPEKTADKPAARDDAAPRHSADEPSPGIGNAGVVAMTQAGFGEGTIIAAIQVNPAHFDVRPRALVELKNQGVSERVIDAMLAAESAKKQAAAVAVRTDDARGMAPQQIPAEEFAKLTAMVQQLAARQEAAAATHREPDPPAAVDRTPHAWIDREGGRTEIAPTIAQVAFTDERDSTRMKTLQGIGSKALAFANPALSGITTTIGNLFGSDSEHKSAVWALAGTAATRELDASPRFEIEYGSIPGVNPDAYQPTLVRLVPTIDNYRLVAAAKMQGAGSSSRPKGDIIEELVETGTTRLSRGRYLVWPASALDAGQYALVLRPIVKKQSRRERKQASLGEMLGGGTTQILYLSWDFAVAAR